MIRSSPGKGSPDGLNHSWRSPPRPSRVQDVEAQNLRQRFQYPARSFASRLLVGANLKTSLAKNRIHQIEYRGWLRYLLIGILALICFVLTPKLLPDLIGFGWATARDFCQSRDTKLGGVNNVLLELSNVTQGKRFIQDQVDELRCINDSAADFYYGDKKEPARVLWPDGCTSKDVSGSLTRTVCVPEVPTEKTDCIEMNGVQKAVTFLAGAKRCKKIIVQPVCQSIVDDDAQKALLHLHEEISNSSAIAETIETIESSAENNQLVQDIVSTGIARIDIASNLYIAYTALSLLVGRPLIIFKRSKMNRICGATIGVRKSTFTIAVVIGITIFDSISSLLKVTDLKALRSNFRADPCYVDPEFSRSKSELIVKTCETVSNLQYETGYQVRKLEELYYDIKLFGLCAVDNARFPHPSLKSVGDRLEQYRSGELRNPSFCNVTFLNDQTAAPAPASKKTSLWDSLLESGVLSQILAKLVLSNLAINLISYFEPLVGHRGRVEVWGDEDISPEEEDAIVRFARDQHLLPLMISIAFSLIEVILLLYAFGRTFGKTSDFIMASFESTRNATILQRDFKCIF